MFGLERVVGHAHWKPPGRLVRSRQYAVTPGRALCGWLTFSSPTAYFSLQAVLQFRRR
jgi:hypothetical protein